jgi:hypothetical protein
LHLCACACRRWWASSPAPRRLALSGRCKLSKLPGSCREARPSPEWEGPDLLRSPTRVLYARGWETKPYLAHVGLFGYDSARHALPRPGGQGPRDPREGSAGEPSGVLPGASREHRTDPTRTSRAPRGLRPEPPSIWGLPDPVRRHL